jgi:predicted ATP-dependent serine protease
MKMSKPAPRNPKSRKKATAKVKKRARKRLISAKIAPETPISGIETFTAFELQKLDFPPTKFAIEGFVPEGLTLLGGKPKIGKSWMAVDFGMAIAKGGLALSSIPCKKGVVLYCALEDNQRRLQRRMLQLYGDESCWPKSFHLTTRMRQLDERGLDELYGWIVDHDPALVIIDTLVAVRPRKQRESGSGYDVDYAALAPLQKLAGELNVCIIVIHHLRKMAGEDPLDTVSGTTGLTGAVDTILVLSRDGNGVTLYGRGREIEEIETALELNNGVWKVLGPIADVRRSYEREAIIKVLKANDEPMSPKSIADELEMPVNNIKQLLRKMVIADEVEKKSRGKYHLPKN